MILNFRFLKKKKRGKTMMINSLYFLVVSKVVGEWTRAVVVVVHSTDCDIHHGPWFGVH
jgi:hypothetical protein